MNNNTDIELRVFSIKMDIFFITIALLIGPILIMILAKIIFVNPFVPHPVWIIGIFFAVFIDVWTIVGAIFLSEYYKRYLGIPINLKH